MEINDINNVKSLIKNLYIAKENNKILIEDKDVLFIDLNQIGFPENEENIDEFVNNQVKIFNPESQNVYLDFYKYFTCKDTLNNFENIIREKCKQAWSMNKEIVIKEMNNFFYKIKEITISYSKSYISRVYESSILSFDLEKLFLDKPITKGDEILDIIYEMHKYIFDRQIKSKF